MTTSSTSSWPELFKSGQPSDLKLNLSVVKKGEEAFLILPDSPALAAKALTLYPAQSTVARFAKKLLGTSLRLRLPIGLGRASLQISSADPFVKFIADLIKMPPGEFPPIAILSGNARAAGRRFIVLVFDEKGEPAFVIKAGLSEAARLLIQTEKNFLQNIGEGIAGLPKLHSWFSSNRMDAFAMPYISGDSPGGEPWPIIGDLLQGWIDRQQRVRIETTPMLKALAKQCPAHPAYPRLSTALDGLEFHPVLFHGDFAPWNIKVSDGSYTVIDWERGEAVGVAGWDWFHYAMQTGILVEKLPLENLVKKLERLFGDPAFKKYAVAAGIQEREKELLIGYLFYVTEIIRPSEGIAAAKALRDFLCGHWLKKS